MLKKLARTSERFEVYLYAIPFMLHVLMLNVHFLLGSLYKPNIIYTALNVLVAMAVFFWAAYTVLKLWMHEKPSRKYLMRLVPVLLFFTACYAIALARFGFYSGILMQAKPFILYASTAVLVGGLVGIKAGETDFFDKAEWFTLISIPVALNYVIMLFTNTSPYTNGGIGIADYMNLSYAYMPLLFTLVIQMARGKSGFLFIKGQRKAYLIRSVLIILIWMLILGCATRGTILCVLVFFVLLIAYLFFMRLYKAEHMKKLFLVFGIIVLQFITFTYVFTPEGLIRLERVNHFTESLKEGEVETARDAPGVKEYGLDKLVNNLSPTYAVDLEKAGIDYTTLDNAWIIGYTIKDRVTIYNLAWKEAVKRPFTGMGPFGFIAKYGNYPHNFVLELFTDLGFIIGSAVLLIIVLCFLKLVINCGKDSNMGFLLVFLCGYVGNLMISGTVWSQPSLLFGIAYSLCYIPARGAVPCLKLRNERSGCD